MFLVFSRGIPQSVRRQLRVVTGKSTSPCVLVLLCCCLGLDSTCCIPSGWGLWVICPLHLRQVRSFSPTWRAMDPTSFRDLMAWSSCSQWSLSIHHCLNRWMGEFGCLALTPSFSSTSKGVGLQGCSQMGLLYYLSLPTSGPWGSQHFQAIWRLQHLPILPALQASAQKWCSTGSFGNILVNITNAQKESRKRRKTKEGFVSKCDLSGCASYQFIATQFKIYPLLSALWYRARPFKHFLFAMSTLLDFAEGHRRRKRLLILVWSFHFIFSRLHAFAHPGRSSTGPQQAPCGGGGVRRPRSPLTVGAHPPPMLWVGAANAPLLFARELPDHTGAALACPKRLCHSLACLSCPMTDWWRLTDEGGYKWPQRGLTLCCNLWSRAFPRD